MPSCAAYVKKGLTNSGWAKKFFNSFRSVSSFSASHPVQARSSRSTGGRRSSISLSSSGRRPSGARPRPSGATPSVFGTRLTNIILSSFLKIQAWLSPRFVLIAFVVSHGRVCRWPHLLDKNQVKSSRVSSRENF